ncbi:hypothetical protein D7U76_09835 [Stenotrophomonas maltophilia]|nr:hypothetical protein [Stenotrophomonas maltophilia]
MAGGLCNHFRGLQLMHRQCAARGYVRFLLVIIAGLALWGVAGAVAAQAYRCTDPNKRVCTQPEANAEAWAHARKVLSGGYSPAQYEACVSESVKSYTGYITQTGKCKASQWSTGHQTFYWGKSCSDESDYTGTGPWSSTGGAARSGSLGCRNGCDGIWGKNADSSFTWSATGAICPDDEKKNCESPAMANAGYYWNVALRVCEPPKPQCEGGKNPNSLGQCAPEPCPDGMAQQADGTCKKKDNECPAGQVRSPDGKCLPGDGQCAAGEVRGPDGTCKRDSDGDGNPDPVDEESFSGGDDCSAPPACSGSPIMCGQARIQWRIDCNTRKNRNIAGGLCNAMPVCTGEKCDAMEYAGLLMQWRSACALEKMAQGTGNGGGENSDVKAIRDALTGTGGAVTTAPDRPSSDVWAPRSGTPVKPDTGGYGWGRTCPQPPSFEVFGNVIQINTAPLCNWLILGSYFVMGLAALASLRIIATRDA